MERFAQDCVNVFCELSGDAKNRVCTAPTPFLEEANDPVAIFEDESTTLTGKGKSSASAGTPKSKASESSASAGTDAACMKIILHVFPTRPFTGGRGTLHHDHEVGHPF